MPRLSLSALLARLEARPPAGVVFLFGDEEYLREEAVKRLLELLLDPATRDFNLDQLRGADASPESLGSVLATPPMMAEYRIVIVRDAQGLAPRCREVVESVVASPTAGLVLLVLADVPRGSRARFWESLKEEALSVECAAVEPLDLPGWLVERSASVHGLEIELDAARALSAAIGSQLGVLAAELEKITAFVGDRTRITLEDVKAVGGYIPRVDRWAWFDRVGERRFGEALSDLPELLDSGESAVGLVIGIGSHLLRLGLLAAGGREGLDRQLRPNQRWLVKRLAPQAKKWTPPEIDHAMSELLRTDRLLKSASLTDRQAMEELLLRLAAARGAPRRSDRSSRALLVSS